MRLFSRSRNDTHMSMNPLRISWMLSRCRAKPNGIQIIFIVEFSWLINPLPVLQAIRPTALIGSAGVGRSFTKEVIEAMSSINEVKLNITVLSRLLFSIVQFSTFNYFQRNAETHHPRSIKPNVTVWMYCWRGIYLESGSVSCTAFVFPPAKFLASIS
jgi:hypothetical protein